VRAAIGPEADRVTGDPLPLALLGWALGCTMVWSALFAIGQYLYGATRLAMGLAAVAIVTALGLARVARALWPASPKGDAGR
jgi:hypothetical protein